MLEKIEFNNTLYAIIISTTYTSYGIEFFTPSDFSQQLGYMNRERGYVIPPHRHNLLERRVKLTQEVLFIKKGKVRADFYNDRQEYLESRILYTGDIILLAAGGHGFEMLEPTEIIEVKQGPYYGEEDKIRFKHVELQHVKIGNHE